jgi:hypothetical protein
MPRRKSTRSKSIKPERSSHRGPDTFALIMPRGGVPFRPVRSPTAENLFLLWFWETGIWPWPAGVRMLARAIRGLERNGWIEELPPARGQRRSRRYCFTDDGRDALRAVLSFARPGKDARRG